MRFTKSNDIYKIVRITGVQDNILGISLTKNEHNKIELIEWNVKPGAQINTSGNQVLKQVLCGLKLINEELGKNYQLSRIYFLPSDSSSNSVYEFLIKELVKYYDAGEKFEEV